MTAPRSLFFAVLLGLVACAQVREPTGGPKDVEAPVLLAADPPHRTTEFTGDRILLTFNEKIKVERARDRVLISPPLEALPTVTLAGPNSVQIQLNAPLEPNTTYVFNIGDAIVDLTENNPSSGLVHVISTGAHVDSLVLFGRVVTATTGAPEKDLAVLAYTAGDSTGFREGRPAYFTRTDANGEFLLPYLRNEAVQVMALRDQNGNYRYDLPNEDIAFAEQLVFPHPPSDTLARPMILRLFREAAADLQLLSVRVIPDGAFELVLSERVSEASVRDIVQLGTRTTWRTAYSQGRDTVQFWPSDTTALRTGRFAVSIADQDLDTIAYRPSVPMPFHTGLSLRTERDSVETKHYLLATRPLARVDSTRIRLTIGAEERSILPVVDTLDPRRLNIPVRLEPGESGSLELLPKAVHDQYGGTNDTLLVRIGRPDLQATGSLHVRLLPPEATSGQLILHLLATNGGVVRSAVLDGGSTQADWSELPPGNYTLRLVEDRNGNGRWDTGSLAERVLPERVWTREESVMIRASWEVDTDWPVVE